jgi:hypothetical protein
MPIGNSDEENKNTERTKSQILLGFRGQDTLPLFPYTCAKSCYHCQPVLTSRKLVLQINVSTWIGFR